MAARENKGDCSGPGFLRVVAWGVGKSGEPVGWRGIIEVFLRSKWEGSGEEWVIPICFVHYKPRLARSTLRRRSATSKLCNSSPTCRAVSASCWLLPHGSTVGQRALHPRIIQGVKGNPEHPAGGATPSSPLRKGRARHRVDTRPGSMSGWRTIWARHTAV